MTWGLMRVGLHRRSICVVSRSSLPRRTMKVSPRQRSLFMSQQAMRLSEKEVGAELFTR